MALQHFMCEPYILLMYIDSSSTLKLGRLSLSRICNETSTNDVVYICSVYGATYDYIHLRGLSVLLIWKTGSQDLSVGWANAAACAFLWVRSEIGICWGDTCSLLRLSLGHVRGRKQMYCLGRVYVQHRLSCYQRISLSTWKEDSQSSTWTQAPCNTPPRSCNVQARASRISRCNQWRSYADRLRPWFWAP